MIDILLGIMLILLLATFMLFLYCAKVLSKYDERNNKK